MCDHKLPLNPLPFHTLLGIMAIVSFSSCFSIPKGAVAVKPFVAEKYMGTWYEIARLDFKYERDLSQTTATYSLNGDGSVKVVNRGYNVKTGEWKEAIGKAKLIGAPDEARLKVSFFGPFYASYNVIALEPDYTYALVVGKNLKYMWILGRTTSIPEAVKQNYLSMAEKLGFKVSDLIWVRHE